MDSILNKLADYNEILDQILKSQQLLLARQLKFAERLEIVRSVGCSTGEIADDLSSKTAKTLTLATFDTAKEVHRHRSVTNLSYVDMASDYNKILDKILKSQHILLVSQQKLEERLEIVLASKLLRSVGRFTGEIADDLSLKTAETLPLATIDAAKEVEEKSENTESMVKSDNTESMLNESKEIK